MNARRAIWSHATVALAVLPLLACGNVDAPAGSDTYDGFDTRMRDSVDVLIVENPRPADGSRLGWRVGPEAAVVTIGKREGDDPYLLYGATDATRLSDGRIVVVNLSASELRVFDDVGTHMETWGGPGEGPNEFDALITDIARLPGDTVMVWTSGHSIMSVVAPTGEVARRFRVQEPAERQGDRLRPVAVLSDGSILTSPTPAFYSTEVQVELRDAEGGLKSSLGMHAGMERHFDMENRVVYPVIFGRDLIREAWGELSVVTLNTRYEIRAFAQDGALSRIVRRDHDIGEDYILGLVTDEMDVEFIQVWPLDRVGA